MKGKVEAYSDKGQFINYKINGDWYSLWKDKGQFNKGDMVEFEYTTKEGGGGKIYRNITKVISHTKAPQQKVGGGNAGGGDDFERRSKALGCAVALAGNPPDGTTLKEWSDKTIDIAKDFSRFLMGKPADSNAGDGSATPREQLTVKLELAGIPLDKFEEFMYSEHGVDIAKDDLGETVAKIDEFIGHYRKWATEKEKQEDDIPF